MTSTMMRFRGSGRSLFISRWSGRSLFTVLHLVALICMFFNRSLLFELQDDTSTTTFSYTADPANANAAYGGMDDDASVTVSMPRLKDLRKDINDRDKHVFCPCNIIGSDCDSSHRLPTMVPNSFNRTVQQPGEQQPVITVITQGRLGNSFFQYGVAVVTSREEGLPLKSYNKPKYDKFPRLVDLFVDRDAEDLDLESYKVIKQVGGHKDAPHVVQPATPFYQHVFWVNKFWEKRQDLCHYLSMPSVLDSAKDRPGPNDVVISIRKFGSGQWNQLYYTSRFFPGEQYVAIPPMAYYEHILQKLNKSYDNLWIIADPCIQYHPFVQHFINRWGAKMRGGTVEQDFQFLSYAKTVILSPSTFYWWAIWMGAASYKRTIHFPIMPVGSHVLVPWCELIMHSWATTTNNSSSTDAGHSRPRMVYHDWFRGKVYNDDPRKSEVVAESEGRIISSSAAKEAFKICKRYETDPADTSAILKFYPELSKIQNDQLWHKVKQEHPELKCEG